MPEVIQERCTGLPAPLEVPGTWNEWGPETFLHALGNRERERGALAHLALHVDLALVLVGEALDLGEPQARAVFFSEGDKALEELAADFRGNSLARVAEAKNHLAALF